MVIVNDATCWNITLELLMTLLESSITVLESSIMLQELPIMLLENIYRIGIAHDDRHMTIVRCL